jgi:transposase-like protein
MDLRGDQPAAFEPPFCPNPKCRFHEDLNASEPVSRPPWRWKRAGFYRRRACPKLIQRFTCLSCRRSFSSQTFLFTYYLKRPDLPEGVFMKAVGGMANRQIARDLQVAPSTIDRVLARIGRHCLLFQASRTANARPQGPLVFDSFESFEYSQYFPFQHHLLAEVESSFFWHFTDSPLRRKGRMTEVQKRRRAALETQLGRPDPQAVDKDVQHLLQVTLGGVPEATVRTDDHRAYPRALRRLTCQVDHQVTSSRERRDAGNPLFEINLLDMLVRHSQANHRRETIAWSKRRQGSADRLAIFLVWRNYVKWRWEKRCRKTPAMWKGLVTRRLGVSEILGERLFRTRIALPDRWAQYYERAVVTPVLGRNRRHELRYAF